MDGFIIKKCKKCWKDEIRLKRILWFHFNEDFLSFAIWKECSSKFYFTIRINKKIVKDDISETKDGYIFLRIWLRRNFYIKFLYTLFIK